MLDRDRIASFTADVNRVLLVGVLAEAPEVRLVASTWRAFFGVTARVAALGRVLSALDR